MVDEKTRGRTVDGMIAGVAQVIVNEGAPDRILNIAENRPI